MLALYKKNKLLIFFYTFVIFLLTQSASLAAYDNQVIQMKNCNNPDMGKANVNVNTNDSEIYLDLEEDGIKGYFPIEYKTQGGIYSEIITLERYASTDKYDSYSEEDDILKVVAKYINNDVAVFPKLKKIIYTLNITKPSSYEHKKIVEEWVAADDEIFFYNDEIYEYKCSEVNFFSSVSNTDSSNTGNNNEYYGIGIAFITKDKEYPVIDRVVKNSPAYKAGLQKGDKLWDISGIDLFDKDSGYIAKLISEAKSPYVMIYYYDVSGGMSRRVSVKPEMIYDQESATNDKEEEEKNRRIEERKRQEDEKKKKDEEKRRQKEAEKDQLIIKLQNDIDALNKEIEQLEEENKSLNDSLNSNEAKLSSNNDIIKENRIYKIFVNFVFTVIVLLIFIITYILIRNNKLIDILTPSKQNKVSSSVKSKEAKEEIEKDVQNEKEKNQDDIQDTLDQKSTEEVKTSKESVGKDDKVSGSKDEKEEQKTAQSKTDILNYENDTSKQPVSDNDVQLDDNENISEADIEEEKSTTLDLMSDDEYTHFIRDYNEAMQNPNSVAQLERKYKITPLERQSPISLETDVVLIKSSQSIIKSNFWMCKFNDGKNMVLPGRSLIARSNELMSDKGRFGSKIFNGIYQLKAAETLKILEPSFCIEQGAEFIITEMGSLTIDAR